MLSRLRTRWADERGVAIITAMLVSMVVLTLGVTSVTLAIHNTEESAYDRRRVQSVAAAEAGLNYYFSHLQSVNAAGMQCSFTKPLTGTPVSSFTATVTFYDANGSAIACPPTSTTPTSARIVSQGTTSGQTSPTRTMEARVNLVPVVGGAAGFGEGAIFSDGNANFDSNVTVVGDGAVNADIYSNAAIVLNSNTVVNGSVYGQSSLFMDSNAEVKANVHVKNAVTMNSNSEVFGNVTSSSSSISVGSSAHVYGNATAGTTISGSGQIDGVESPNSPQPGTPTARTFPSYTFNEADWTAQGYTVHTYTDCNDAESFIEGITSGKRVVRITATCQLAFTNDENVTVDDDLAIISNGSFLMDSNSVFTSSGGSPTLHLMFGYGGTPPSCTNGIEFKSNSYIDSAIDTLLWTPCGYKNDSNSFVGSGQIFAGNVDFNSNTSLTYKLISVPGVSSGSDLFDEDIVYIREIVTGS
jgi:Tfp pilus assembly protein PilX